jgi:ATP/maltotriose-dependent transcriptional regulator MalT
MMSAHTLLGELDDALALGTRALSIAQQLGNVELRILNTSHLEQVYLLRGEYERVTQLAADNLAALKDYPVYERFGAGAPISILDRVYLIQSLVQLGRFSDAAKCQAEVMRLAEPTQNAFMLSSAHSAAAALSLQQGNWAKARSQIDAWISVAKAGNIVIQLPTAIALSVWVLAQLGETSEALNRYREAEQIVERLSTTEVVAFRSWIRLALGRGALLIGRLDEAQRLSDQVADASSVELGLSAHALHLGGDIASHRDRFDAQTGEARYRQALALAEPRSMRPLVAHCHLGLAKLYRRIGRTAQVHGPLTTATTMYREMDMPFWLEEAGKEMSQLA